MKKTLILGPQEIQKLIQDFAWDTENIRVPRTATVDAKVRYPGSGASETYLIVSWDIAE